MELEATYRRAVHVWWAFFWRSIIATILGSILSAILGGILGFIMGFIGFGTGAISFFSGILGFVIGLGISIVPVKLILNKNYGEFELVLLLNQDKVQNLDAMWSRAVKVWWAYIWRNFLLLVGWMIIVGILTRILRGILESTTGAGTATFSFVIIVWLIIAIISSLVLSVIPVKLILGKDFGEFTLALLKTESSMSPEITQT